MHQQTYQPIPPKVHPALYSKIYILATLALLLTLSACDSYQKVLKSSDLQLKYDKAKEYYNNEDYYKAQPLFEELISVYKGTKDIEDIYYYYAYCHYGQGNYLLASFHFRTFYTNYPYSKYAEECRYMHAFCYYQMSPEPSLDQTHTRKAIEAFQLFINAYPKSGRVEECNMYIDKMRAKLAYKDYKSAELYFRLGYYKAAATSFKNLLTNYPDIKDREKIMLFVLRSHYQLANKSIPEKKVERYEQTILTYYEFVEKYKTSKYLKEAENLFETAQNQLNKIKGNEQQN